MPNIGEIISANNKRVLSDNQVTSSDIPPCNCRIKSECPLNGICRSKEVVYQATVKAQNTTPRKYIGLCETEFKVRWYNHKQSFKNRKLENATELSKFVWACKDKKLNPEIEWNIIRNASAYTTKGSKACQLCLTEKYLILTGNTATLLNKRSEILSKCRHKAKFKLKNL